MNDHTEATSTTRLIAPLAIILGIPMLFAAVFFYTSPVVLQTGGAQGIFKCGSPSAPNTDAENVCGVPEEVARNKALYSGLSGVALVGLGAVWLLRGQRDDDDWDDDDFDVERSRRRHRDDIDQREDTRERDERGRSEGLRGVDRRRSVLRDEDFADPPPRRRADDDWSSDGWR